MYDMSLYLRNKILKNNTVEHCSQKKKEKKK